MNRVAVNPELVQWARQRAHLAIEDLTGRFPKLGDWERGEVLPTFKQLEDFARATHVPFGYLFLPEPPLIPMPITDFRTLGNQYVGSISPDLLDTIYAMQQRQAWLRETRIECEVSGFDFVGSARLTDDPAAIGREMRRLLDLEDGWANQARTWQEAISALRTAIEAQGILAIINGVVGNNTHRVLNVDEFRGFALSDEFAPLIFVNGADAKSAQMFTLAHELAHIWLGSQGSGLSGFPGIFPDGGEIENFCDRAAAEFLVPEAELRQSWPNVRREEAPFSLLARQFKVSPIVVGRRAIDLRLVERQYFFEFYAAYVQQERQQKQAASSGGDFYNNQNARVGKKFALQVIRAAKEGRIGFRQAYELTGLKGGAFQEYAQRLGVELPR
ncbi:ImmA/IrrE family metallo-endopeptidase [Halomonas sp. FME1]|uniref:ImmA/IrrE family metallo-endopeptidase n=1 Tax=Halomonas casei TaxID=2742613 RepID=A0ABR9F2P7_9GAMM|nr:MULTISPECIES: ImmA/IrrE family metallo-endopeptidase [Halomonas]MBE0399515.1 ImmA/IrrE family metallo-endopeptidase [Halomonas casei]PCC23472.1 DNA-binding protein [Halomonas sp. JB37]